MVGRNLITAIAVGFALAGLIMVCLFFLPPFGFVWFIYVFAVLAVVELRNACRSMGIRIPTFTIDASMAFTFAFTYLFPWHFCALGVCLFFSLSVIFIRGSAGLPMDAEGVYRPVSRIRNACASAFVATYIILLSSFLILALTRENEKNGMEMMIIFLPALSDIGGLAIGASFGRHKMSTKLSPKKSYEGLLGSLAFSGIGAMVFWAIFFRSTFVQDWWKSLIVGLCAALIGTFGDFSASVIKRDVGIKDYGNLIKGHGGVLDRTDSVLMAAPFIYLLLIFFLQR